MSLVQREISEGTVLRKEKGRIMVSLDIQGCPGADNCTISGQSEIGGGCACGKSDTIRKMTIPVTDAESFSMGDRVRFSHAVPNPGMVAFIVFGIPLLLTLAVMIIWYLRAPSMIESPAAIASAFGAFAAGFLVVRIFDAYFRKHYPVAVLERRSSAGGLQERTADGRLV